jgi:type II secretory pathway component PulM
MPHKTPPVEPPPAARLRDAEDLLQGLEALREELGGVADDIINALREAGVTPAAPPKSH